MGIDWSKGNELIFCLLLYLYFYRQQSQSKTCSENQIFRDCLLEILELNFINKHLLFWVAPRLPVKRKKSPLLLRKRKGEVKNLSLSFRVYMVGAATHQLKCNQLPETELQHSSWILQPTENYLLKGIQLWFKFPLSLNMIIAIYLKRLIQYWLLSLIVYF